MIVKWRNKFGYVHTFIKMSVFIISFINWHTFWRFNSFLIMNTFVEGEELRLVTMASRLQLLVLVLSATAHAQGPDQQGTYTVLYSRVGQLFVVPLAAKWEIKKKQIMILVQKPWVALLLKVPIFKRFQVYLSSFSQSRIGAMKNVLADGRWTQKGVVCGCRRAGTTARLCRRGVKGEGGQYCPGVPSDHPHSSGPARRGCRWAGTTVWVCRKGVKGGGGRAGKTLAHPLTTPIPHARPGVGYICCLWVLLGWYNSQSKRAIAANADCAQFVFPLYSYLICHL